MIDVRCKLCNNWAPITEHRNDTMFDIYVCAGCQAPHFKTRYREIYPQGDNKLLGVSLRIDDYYVVLNYGLTYRSRKTNFTSIYKKIIGELESSSDLEPITWDADSPVVEFDFILKLPHDVRLIKQKLQTYTLFS
jgi:hypothetical protein